VIGLLQRVKESRVAVEGKIRGEIGPGLLVLVGVSRGDDENKANRLLERLLGYRIFPDAAGKMNLSLPDVGGGLLLVPQFTLAADTRKGMPIDGSRLFHHLVELARERHPLVECGVFGADMQVSLINDGPVTFWLEV